MWVFLFLLIISIGIVTPLSYALYISLKKIELYESFILKRRDSYTGLLSKIRELDQREMFEKDEDVGIIFSDIKDEIEQFDKFIE